MRTPFPAFIVLALAAVSGLCQAGTSMDLDHACFRAGDSLGFVEIYAGIHRSGLEYRTISDTVRCEFAVRLAVFQDTQVVLQDTFRALDVLDTIADRGAPGQFFTHAFRFIMKPGRYGLRVWLSQFGSAPTDSVSDSVAVPAFAAGNVRLSDIEIGSRLEYATEPSPFTKNGVRMVPNPTRFFGTQLPVFYYYMEAYGLDFDSAAVDSYEVVRRVIEGESGKLSRPENRRTYHTAGKAVVIADGFPVATLRTGTYNLELQVTSLRSGQSATARKKFWTYRHEDYAPGQTPKTGAQYDSKLSGVGPDILEVVDADSAALWMKYILTPEEYKRLDRLTADGKREFVRVFWRQQEAQKAGAANQYFARVVEANRRWTVLRKPGWKTDRGRIFIMYGEPDRNSLRYGTSDMPDHEVWEYDRLEAGVQFVFFDKRGIGDLELVHSTKQGEIYNPNWWYQYSPAKHGTLDGMR